MADTKLAVSTIGWPTKAEAGRALGVSTKTIEKYVEQGRLRQQMQSQINKPQRAVIDPETVEKMLAERSSLMVREQAENPSAMIGGTLRELFAKRDLPPSELRHRIYLTEAEAVRYTGLGRAFIRGTIAAPGRKIGPRGAVVYRRVDLEAL